MDYSIRDSPKYPDTAANQPGLEVHYQPPPGDPPEEQRYDPNERKKILGLSVGVFWGIVVVLCLLIGGGVGGGVGAGLASRKNTCSENATDSGGYTATTTITISSTKGSTLGATSTSARASISPAPSSHCSDQSSFNGSFLTPLGADGNPFSLSGEGSQTFRIFCNTNWPGGAFYGNPDIHDIMRIYQPTLEDCVAACASYNAGYQSSQNEGVDVGGGLCRAVALVLAEGEYCFLKNGTGLNDTSTSGPGKKIDSAMLLL